MHVLWLRHLAFPQTAGVFFTRIAKEPVDTSYLSVAVNGLF